MNNRIFIEEPSTTILQVTRLYARLVFVGFTLIPAYLIGYLYFFQNPALKFEDHTFHEIAIAIASIEGVFVTYVTWRCYRVSGEKLLRWMALAFLGFVLVYLPHGVFTGQAHQNIWLFLLYGPASRFTMAILLFVALLSYKQCPDSTGQRAAWRTWLVWVAAFVLLDVAVAYLAFSPIAGALYVRLAMEGGALVVCLLNVAVLFARRIRSPLMSLFAASLTIFSLSSAAFILGRPWNHMWWLAHAIFAAGFLLLSYGVVQAFLTTRSFSTVYSQEELMARLKTAMASTENALQELQCTNQTLEHLAATDPLTGVENRRRFIEHVEVEIRRSKAGRVPFSLLALDLDNFKSVNDRFGHQVGDEILKAFVKKSLEAIRPYDAFARVGGEEFLILLPETSIEAAQAVAERLRTSIAEMSYDTGTGAVACVTVSIGVSQFGEDGLTIDEILHSADDRLYNAKNQGRDRVVAA